MLGHHAQISREMKQQVLETFGEIPKDMKLINCVGGGSSAMGFWNEWIDHDNVELIGVEAGGPEGSNKHAAPLSMTRLLEFFMEQPNMLFKTIKVRLKKLTLSAQV